MTIPEVSAFFNRTDPSRLLQAIAPIVWLPFPNFLAIGSKVIRNWRWQKKRVTSKALD